ncbi:hypothetical protein MUCCIDRAFT_115457 [Mucor lusitanicus CBS 277.49]|uniref:Uncharacterized protein n=2 Tax=Mucor circinelloides f. lusitanicus TaxID=29924 RepID=A0A168H9U1_MUCCL|nr:hypothetical protein MUCCIDRAFT_115457 [Mucor lusitanicus CBS 277.49]
MLTHANYTYYVLSLEVRYTTLILLDKIRFVYVLVTNRNLKTTPPATPVPPLSIQNETYTGLISTLSPYERKVVDRLLLQYQDNSTRLANYFVKKIKLHSEEWESLAQSWNTPLELPENERPYQYQPDQMEQKLSSLVLEHNLKMMAREIEVLYWQQYYQNLNFYFGECIHSKALHENRTSYYQVQLFLEAQRNESLYYTQMYMLKKLHHTKDNMISNLQDSYRALNETIHVERGPYYNTLHPDHTFTIRVKRTEYKVISRHMKAIWIDWPRENIRQGEPLNYWQQCYAMIQRLWNLCVYLSKKWHEIKRAYMRRLLHGISSIQSRLGSIREYLFA